jgi:hypothetical protein
MVARRLVIISVLATSACATPISVKQPVLPLDLVGVDGPWLGSVDAHMLRIDDPRGGLLRTHPEHVVEGRTTVLVNTVTDDGRYISMSIDRRPCSARGQSYPFTVSACIAPNDDRYNCVARIKGCAKST